MFKELDAPLEAAETALDAPQDDPGEITLTEDQSKAMREFIRFIMDPAERVFVLRGYSGTGKTTLIRVLLQRLPGIRSAAKLINPKAVDLEVQLTATTNKAAEAFRHLTKQEVTTIHSFLGLRVHTDYTTMKTSLSVGRKASTKFNYLLFIDEASYIDQDLLRLIFAQTRDCKIVFMGDPAQITPINSSSTPVFDMKVPGAALTKVMRQAEGNPIIALATKFRETVNTGEFFSFTPDGQAIQYLERDDFDKKIVAEFSRPDWGYHDSKILAYTNRIVIAYNHAVRDLVKGSPNFQPGDYAVCNSYVKGTEANKGIRTDEMVLIHEISDLDQVFGVQGRHYRLDQGSYFMPLSLEDWKAAISRLKAAKEYTKLADMDQTWIDLRAAFSCTINKSQGSTFDRVFIDLDDVRSCTNGNLMARLLYVGVSRARSQVFLTGDIFQS
jgi:hypothetical protein